MAEEYDFGGYRILLFRRRIMESANGLRTVEDSSGSEEVSDNESDLASILQYLIRSGQVRILGRENPYVGALPRLPPCCTPNMEQLNKSELSYLTKRACGMLQRGPRPSTAFIPDLVYRRQCGMLTSTGFSNPEKRRIENTRLPSKMKLIDTYENKAFCGIYSKDGNTLLTASQDRCIRVYDASNGQTFKLKELIQGRDIGWSILDVAFSPDSQKVAYSSWSSSLHMVDIGRGDTAEHITLPLSPQERRFCVFSLLFSESGEEILCSANDGFFYIFNLNTNQRTLKVAAHDEDVNAIAFADESSTVIYSGGDDGFIKVWDRRTVSEENPVPVGILAGHLDGITYIDSRGDGRHLVSNSKDQSIKLWDNRVMSPKSTQDSAKRIVRRNRWDYRWQTAPKKLVTRKKNIKGDSSLATFKGHSVLQTLIRCHFSPQFTTGQRYIITGCAFGRVIIYDILTGETIMQDQGHSSCVRDVSWHPYRPEIISSSWDFTVVCWNHHFDMTEAIDVEELRDIGTFQDIETPGYREIPPLRRSKRIADRARLNNPSPTSSSSTEY